MFYYYGTAISDHIKEKPDGGIVCTDVPIARTGEMQYLASELRLDGDPNRVVTVIREPEDVFEQDALSSFEGCHVTDGHPPENVTAENFGAYSRGHIQGIRRKGDYVVGDIHINDKVLASEVLHKVRRQISCGYECVYQPLPDGRYKQTRIRGNHVAVVLNGRAGPSVSIHDSAGHAGKGKNTMSKFAEAVLKMFGTAAKDAGDDQAMNDLVATTMTALDAEPAGSENAAPAPETEPEAKEKASADAADPAAPLSGLESKLDKLIELLTARDKQPEKPEGEKALDQMIASLDGGSAATIPAGGAADACVTGPARDAALAMLRSMRPVVASIEDAATRTKVTDALLGAIKSPDMLGGILQAAQQNAQKASDAAAPASFDKLCADQKAAYDARNPHKRKEDN